MKNAALPLFVPVVSIVLGLAGITACEDSGSSSGNNPGGDGGSGFDGGGAGDGSGGDGGAVVNNCPAPTASPVTHDKTIDKDETWGPGYHDVTFDVAIRKNATLTVEPCAIVRTVASRGMQVGSGNEGDGGKLVAKGAADRPIFFEVKDAGKKWAGILVNAQGSAELAYVTIKDGGDKASSRGGGNLHLFGDQYKPLQPLATLDHVTLEASAKYGVVLEGRAGFADGSRDVVVKGSGDMAMRVPAIALSTIPTGTYTGNTVDAIRVLGSSGYDYVTADVTIRDRGVPYVVGGDGQFGEISVQGAAGTAPLLTIEAGVTLKFPKGDRNSGLFVERASTTEPARGALRALGTAAKPVVFTSSEATPAPGDWVGIVFNGIPDPRTKIDFARVEYAGGDTGTRGFSCGTEPSPDKPSNEAAIAIFGQPGSAFVTNTTIAKSAANAFERAWTGTPVDFLATNTLTEITWCKQTFPRPTVGSCPDPAPCE